MPYSPASVSSPCDTSRLAFKPDPRDVRPPRVLRHTPLPLPSSPRGGMHLGLRFIHKTGHWSNSEFGLRAGKPPALPPPFPAHLPSGDPPPRSEAAPEPPARRRPPVPCMRCAGPADAMSAAEYASPSRAETRRPAPHAGGLGSGPDPHPRPGYARTGGRPGSARRAVKRQDRGAPYLVDPPRALASPPITRTVNRP